MPHQVFSIHPDNHRCFQFKGKPFKILTSAEHYGAVLNADFDYDTYLQEMSRTGQNMTRTFTFYREKESSIPGPGGMNTLAPTPVASVMPWERVPGYGKAADGLDKFDLERWNSAYFERFRDFVKKCDDYGIICEIVFFCNPYSQDRFDLFPCSFVSNINEIGRDLNVFRDFLTLSAPSIVAFQENFVKKMVKEMNEFDNVYYEICNEPYVGGVEYEEKVIAWHAHLARVIRQAEESLPKRHLIAANAHFAIKVKEEPGKTIVRHEDLGYFENPDIDIVNYHYISEKVAEDGLNYVRTQKRGQAGVIWGFMRQRDKYKKPIVFDETFSGVVRGYPERYHINRAEAWEMILSGGAGYDNLDWSFIPADETGSGKVPIDDGRRLDGRCLREWIRIFHSLLGQYDLSTLVPAVDMIPESIPGYGYAALTDNKGKYLLYIVDESLYRAEQCKLSPLSIKLRLPADSHNVKSFDPKTGVTADLPALQVDGKTISLLNIPPFSEDIVIIIN